MEPRLQTDEELTQSAVVANCAMNRERQLAGPNSYTRELGFHPLHWLRRNLAESGQGTASTYSPRKHRITCSGGQEKSLPYTYLGADDQAGPGCKYFSGCG